MSREIHIEKLASKVEEMRAIAMDLYEKSEDFPALNRNLKRMLAAVEVIKMNLESGTDQ